MRILLNLFLSQKLSILAASDISRLHPTPDVAVALALLNELSGLMLGLLGCWL